MAKKSAAPHCADTRAKEGQRGFAGLPMCVIKSEAYRTLSMIARAILIEIVATMNGHNNGKIHKSYKELALALNRKNQAPIGPAIAELMDHGLIDISAESVWQERKAREYRLTFVNTTDSIGRPVRATNSYLKWTSRVKNDATHAVPRTPKVATAFVASRKSVGTHAVPTPNAKPRKPLNEPATHAVIPIIKPYTTRRISEGGDTDPDGLGGHFSNDEAAILHRLPFRIVAKDDGGSMRHNHTKGGSDEDA